MSDKAKDKCQTRGGSGEIPRRRRLNRGRMMPCPDCQPKPEQQKTLAELGRDAYIPIEPELSGFVKKIRKMSFAKGKEGGLSITALIDMLGESADRIEHLEQWQQKIRLQLTAAKNVGYCKVRKGQPIDCPLEKIHDQALKET